MSENVGSIVYEIDANTSGLVAANKQVDTANKKIQSGFAKTDKAMAATVKGSGKLSNSIRQASMQLSQVAQQGSVTGNYLQALAIQLPDLALGFGTVGIIAGALAGTLGVALIDSLGGADKSADDLKETLKGLGSTFKTTAGESNELNDELQRLYEISKSTAQLNIKIRTDEAEEAVKDVRMSLSSAIADGLTTNTFIPQFGLDEIISRGGVARSTIASLASAAKLTKTEVIDLSNAFNRTKDATDAAPYENLSSMVLELRKKYGDSNEAVNELSEGLAKQIPVAIQAMNTLKKLKSASDELASGGDNFTTQGNGDAEGERLASLYAERQKAATAIIEQTRKQFQDEQTLADEQLTERLTAIDDAQISVAEKEQAEYEARALHAQKLAELDAKRTTNEQAEAAKRLTLKKMELAAYTQLGGQLTNLVAAAGAENTAIGKAVFLANQALAVAGIIVNTQAAAAATLPLDPTGSLSARVTTLGYTSAAIAGGIAVGQTFSGRQTGGPTEANTPYRVGESGPELFTSGGRQFLIGGEKGNVTPNNQLGGGMSAPQVNVVVNNNTTSNVSVSQEQDGNNVTIQMLVADFAEGGPVSRSMSSSFNTKRKTT